MVRLALIFLTSFRCADLVSYTLRLKVRFHCKCEMDYSFSLIDFLLGLALKRGEK